jgi:hypothetical protein
MGPISMIAATVIVVVCALILFFYVLPKALVQPPKGYPHRDGLIVPAPPEYKPGVGLAYAHALTATAQKLGMYLLVLGWCFIPLAAVLAVTGSLVGSDLGEREFELREHKTERKQDGDSSADVNPANDEGVTVVTVAKRRSRSIFDAFRDYSGIICSAIAVVLAALGWQCLDRSSSATRTSSIANTAIMIASSKPKDGQDGDRKAYDICVEAKSAWLEGRMSHERIQQIIQQSGALAHFPPQAEPVAEGEDSSKGGS